MIPCRTFDIPLNISSDNVVFSLKDLLKENPLPPVIVAEPAPATDSDVASASDKKVFLPSLLGVFLTRSSHPSRPS